MKAQQDPWAPSRDRGVFRADPAPLGAPPLHAAGREYTDAPTELAPTTVDERPVQSRSLPRSTASRARGAAAFPCSASDRWHSRKRRVGVPRSEPGRLSVSSSMSPHSTQRQRNAQTDLGLVDMNLARRDGVCGTPAGGRRAQRGVGVDRRHTGRRLRRYLTKGGRSAHAGAAAVRIRSSRHGAESVVPA